MKSTLMMPALAAAMIGAWMPAWAQERGYHNDAFNRVDARDQRHDSRDERGPQRGERMQADRHGDRPRDQPHDQRRGERDDRRMQGGWGRTADYRSGYEGFGPDHNLHRGERLPSHYRNHQYVVDNWRAHHLSAPPRGHHWVQVGADYVLVAAATGLIVQAVMGQ